MVGPSRGGRLYPGRTRRGPRPSNLAELGVALCELRCIQRRLSPAQVEALIADYEGGGRIGELARIYGIHRTTVSARVSRRVRPAVS
jgi:DNA-directed RNA polymerase specialized sigma24 family protein